MRPQYVKSAFDLWIPAHRADAFEKEAKNLLFKRKSEHKVKTTDDESCTDVSIVSAETVDIEGDLILQDGINWTQYKDSKVPVLYGHEGGILLPVGKSLWQKREGTTTLAKTQYAKTSFAQDCYLLVKTGFLDGKSIGFTCYPEDLALPTEQEQELHPGVLQVIKRCDIWEYSLTPTPCNRDALLQEVKSLLQPNTLKHLGITEKQIAGAVKALVRPALKVVPKEDKSKIIAELVKSIRLTDQELDELYSEAEEEIYSKYSA